MVFEWVSEDVFAQLKMRLRQVTGETYRQMEDPGKRERGSCIVLSGTSRLNSSFQGAIIASKRWVRQGIDETEEWARMVSGSRMWVQGSKRLLTLPLGLRHMLKKNS